MLQEINWREPTAARRRIPVRVVKLDGITAKTGLNGATAKISKAGGTPENVTLVEIDGTNAPGDYYVELSTSQCDTEGFVLGTLAAGADNAKAAFGALIVNGPSAGVLDRGELQASTASAIVLRSGAPTTILADRAMVVLENGESAVVGSYDPGTFTVTPKQNLSGAPATGTVYTVVQIAPAENPLEEAQPQLTAAPPIDGATVAQQIGFLYHNERNAAEETDTSKVVKQADGSTNAWEHAVTDDGTTTSRGPAV